MTNWNLEILVFVERKIKKTEKNAQSIGKLEPTRNSTHTWHKVALTTANFELNTLILVIKAEFICQILKGFPGTISL